MLFFITFVLSCISILYEFALAQFITLFFGSTFEIYSITIGLYTFSLGLGALGYEFFFTEKPQEALLLRTEVGISITAVVSPFLIVLLSTEESLYLLGDFAKIFAFLPVALCGWFSGIELPCLLNLGKQEKHEEVIFVDFFGMFIGALIFPFFLIDNFGPLTIIWCLSAANILTVMLFVFRNKVKINKKTAAVCVSSMALLLLLVTNEGSLISLFQRIHGV